MNKAKDSTGEMPSEREVLRSLLSMPPDPKIAPKPKKPAK